MNSVIRRATIGVFVLSSPLFGQSSSMWRAAAASPPQTADVIATGGPSFTSMPPAEASLPGTRALETVSFIGIAPAQPRRFKVHDQVSVIVRQQKQYEADGQLNSERRWNMDGELSNWFRFYDDVKHLGSDKLSNGKPGFTFDYNNRAQNRATNDREDSFITRVQAFIIDVKPNGNLVIEARMREEHDEEIINITLTGTCRSEDVTAANTILSTQIADLVLIEKNEGSVRDTTKRGFIPRLFDFAKPF